MTRRGLWIALALLVACRMAVVASAGDVFGYGEEFTKGAAAKAMLDGLPIEHHRLAYGYHEGGGFAVTHLKALLFLVMGPSMLAHKVAALILCCVLLAVVVAFAREHLGAGDRPESTEARGGFGQGPTGAEGRARVQDSTIQAGLKRTTARQVGDVGASSDTGRIVAWAAAAFFVLAPTNFVRFSLLNLGTHFEAQIFSLLVLHFTLRITRTGTSRARDAFWLGVSGGFGLYFSLTLLPALAASALWILVHRRARVVGRETGIALGGFALGALPLWIMLALIGKEAVVVGGHEATRGLGPFLEAIAGIPAPILQSKDPWTWASALFVASLVAVGCVRSPRRAHALVAIALLVYTVAYGASGYALEYQPDRPYGWFFLLRLTPYWIAATLFAAHGAAIAWASRGRVARAFAAAAIAVVCLAGARDGIAMCAEGRPSAPMANLSWFARAKGYTFPDYFDKLQDHIDGGRAEVVRVLRAYDEDPRRLWPGIVQSIFDRSRETPAEAVDWVRGEFEADAPSALRGLGRFLHTDWNYDLKAAFGRVASLPEEVREPLVEGLGRAALGPRFLVSRLEEAASQEVPESWRAAWLRGCGWRAHMTFLFRPDLADAFVASRPAADQPALRAGLIEARELDTLK